MKQIFPHFNWFSPMRQREVEKKNKLSSQWLPFASVHYRKRNTIYSCRCERIFLFDQKRSCLWKKNCLVCNYLITKVVKRSPCTDWLNSHWELMKLIYASPTSVTRFSLWLRIFGSICNSALTINQLNRSVDWIRSVWIGGGKRPDFITIIQMVQMKNILPYSSFIVDKIKIL